jgi:hypothetical protein
MQPIRKEAIALAIEGRLVIYRKGRPLIRSISKGFIGWACQGSISFLRTGKKIIRIAG